MSKPETFRVSVIYYGSVAYAVIIRSESLYGDS